jgi:hypothetical protein
LYRGDRLWHLHMCLQHIFFFLQCILSKFTPFLIIISMFHFHTCIQNTSTHISTYVKLLFWDLRPIHFTQATVTQPVLSLPHFSMVCLQTLLAFLSCNHWGWLSNCTWQCFHTHLTIALLSCSWKLKMTETELLQCL